ncbi:hypothetical protein ABMA27_017037 [Loxostege sticticalis]|uniref:Alsin n=1 Tax=Loxostege sticticalis TaxID=481309 RepID=A0ABR3GYG5_LOXSC
MEKHHMYLWRGVDRIDVTFGDKPNGIVQKLVNVKNHIFVSTNTCNLYHGEISNDDNISSTNLVLKRIEFVAVDIASNSDYLFVVKNDGCVVKIVPDSMSIVETIVLREDRIAADNGNGQLWASGDQPQIDVKCTTPKKVIFFDGRTISDVACGINFNVAIARKIMRIAKDDTDSENDAEEVFVNSCPRCLSNIMPSPMSMTSSDTCPMSIHRQQYSEDHSMNSTSSMSMSGKHHEMFLSDVKEKEDTNSGTIMANGDEFCSESVETSKEEKKNVIFINTEAARQFLTRQLSWVSSYGNSKEDFSIGNDTERVPGTIKQNVSTMANLVYEGVKTMGDKVATLSRHMSGSSDMNDSRDDIINDFEHIGDDSCKQHSTSLAHSLRCEEFPWSSSTGSLDHELSQQGLNERINSLVHNGNNLLSTELWTWGDFRYGQLGTGDTIIRTKPVLVTKLNNMGLKKIACGDSHTLALSLDGRVYTWGRNNCHQVCPDNEDDRSSPILFDTKKCNDERARDMASGSEHSLFKKKGGATQESNVYETLCRCYTELMSFTALNVLSLWDYFNHIGEAYEIMLVANIEEFITIYKLLSQRYLRRHISRRFHAHDENRQRCAAVVEKILFGKIRENWFELLRSPERRLIRESRTHPLALFNSSRFSSHWFVLLTDVFVHVVGASNSVHQLRTLWVEPQADSETLQNVITITAPEENFVLYTPTPTERNDWLQALQSAIKCSLQRVVGHVPPLVRTSSYSYIKHQLYKDAKYTGRWLNGKPHGIGKLEWNDGRMYTGQFYKGVIQGSGKMELPAVGIYEGQWKDGQQNGHGSFKYVNGDVYEGHFKDGLPHGHGMKKEGHFMASVASVYIGEWANGLKQGYGIMDDIMTGEKYLGSWSNDMKHGCGLIVTLDGIYYEGVFVQDVLTGHGVMVFEDGTHYEGEFKSAGIFCGKGTLTFRSGDRLEGNMSGAWNEGVKVNAVLHINKATGNSETNEKPTSFGKLCVPPDQKWRAIFRQCYQHLGISEPSVKGLFGNNDRSLDSQRIWQNVAVILNKSHQKTLNKRQGSPSKLIERDKDRLNESLNKIPNFGREKLTLDSYNESPEHPLGSLLAEIATVYTATYGGVRVHPLLLSHAVTELRSITSRIYELVTLFFPALPKGGKECVLGTEDEANCKVISAAAILHPILLPRVHSALFVLYALHNKKEDDLSLGSNALTSECEPFFTEAIETLQQLKTTFSPLEKLLVIRNTFEQMTQPIYGRWTNYFRFFNFVVVRASVLQLGSEIHFIEDFMEPYLENGELGIMFTTLKSGLQNYERGAAYQSIITQKL